jgi:hypothetical protein
VTGKPLKFVRVTLTEVAHFHVALCCVPKFRVFRYASEAFAKTQNDALAKMDKTELLSRKWTGVKYRSEKGAHIYFKNRVFRRCRALP